MTNQTRHDDEPYDGTLGRVVIEEQRLREPYTLIPNTILRRADLSPGAKLTYIVLLSYAWQSDQCFPGQGRLAQDLGIGRRSVIRHLQELTAGGWLQVKRRGLGQTNIYILRKWSDAGRARLALPEMPDLTHQGVPSWHPKQYQQNTTQIHTDAVSNSTETVPGTGAEVIDPTRVQVLESDTPQRTRRSRRIDPIPIADIVERVRQRARSVGVAIEASAHRALGEGAELDATVREISVEFGDRAHLRANRTQVRRLWRSSGCTERHVAGLLHEARALTRDAMTRRRSGHGPPVRNGMAYFFACLRELLANRQSTVGTHLGPPAGVE